MNISDLTRVQVLSGATAAGQTAINGGVIDLTCASGVRALALFGDVAATSVCTLQFQTGNLADGSDMANVTGASVSHTATATSLDNRALSLDIAGLNPNRRYGRFVITRATADAVVLAMIGEIYDTTNVPAAAGDAVGRRVVRG